MWYLSRTGETEGPFNEAVIVDMIRSGLAKDGHICPVGGSTWVRLAEHPAFDAAMKARDAAPASSANPALAPAAPTPAPSPSVAHDAPTLMAPASMRPAAIAMAPTPDQNPQAPQLPSFVPMQPQQQPQPQGGSFAPNANGVPASFVPPMSGGPVPYGSMGPAPTGSYGPPPGSMHPMGQQSQGQFGMGPAFMPPPETGKSKLGVIIAGVAVVLVVLGGGGAFALWMALRAPAPLAQYYPDNTEAYVEVPGIKRSLLSLASVEVIDGSRVDEKKALEEAKDTLGRAFDLSPTDAARVAMGIGSVAFGGRDFEHRDQSSVALMIAFDDAAVAEKLLASDRFTKEDDVGGGGKRYSLKRREREGGLGPSVSAIERNLSNAQITVGKRDNLVWFPKKKLLVLANQPALDDTIALVEGTNKKTLVNSPAYVAQKARLEGHALVGFADSSLIKNVEKAKDYEKYFRDTGLITLSAGFEKPGVRMTMGGTLSIPEDQLAGVESTNTLSLAGKLPKETFAYLGFTSRLETKGKPARDVLFDRLSSDPSGATMQKMVEEQERATGVSLTTVFQALGDEGVIGVAARDGFKYVPGVVPSFDDLAVIYLQKTRDLAAAKQLTNTLKTKLGGGGPFKVQNGAGDDFVVEGEKSFPRGELRHVGSHLLVVVGSRELADRTFAAFGGKATLGDDRAHRNVTDPLKATHLLFWSDLGRVGESALSSMPELKDKARDVGLDVGLFHLTGDRRVNGAVAVNLSVVSEKGKPKQLGYTVDSLNLPVMGVLTAALAPRSARRHAFDAPIADSTGTGIGAAGSLDSKGDFPRSGLLKPPQPSSGNTLSGTTSVTNGVVTGAPPSTQPVPTKPIETPASDDLPSVCSVALTRYDRCVYKSVPQSSRPQLIRSLRETILRQQPKFRATTCQSLLDAADRSNPGCK